MTTPTRAELGNLVLDTLSLCEDVVYRNEHEKTRQIVETQAVILRLLGTILDNVLPEENPDSP